MNDYQGVKELFRKISARYNFVNSVLSLGLDTAWRKTLAQAVAETRAVQIADLASGSGVLAFAIARKYARRELPCVITGYDFCEELLAIARTDAQKSPATKNLRFETADVLALPCANASCDCVTIGFGLRNFADRPRAYAEIRRVLKPGGRLFILEFSQPRGLMRPLFRAYQALIPSIAGLCGADAESYRYLNRTVRAWPDAPTLAAELTAAGFSSVRHRLLTGGIVALHEARHNA